MSTISKAINTQCSSGDECVCDHPAYVHIKFPGISTTAQCQADDCECVEFEAKVKDE